MDLLTSYTARETQAHENVSLACDPVVDLEARSISTGKEQAPLK